jgi:hypothetical protein
MLSLFSKQMYTREGIPSTATDDDQQDMETENSNQNDICLCLPNICDV